MTRINSVSFNIAFLKESAAELAKVHLTLVPGKKASPVKPILEKSRETLIQAYRTLSSIAKSDQELSPAAEWLIDNFYIIQEQIVQAETDFPKEYQKSLPLFSSGENAGMPYVFEAVRALLNHTDNQLDMDVLTQYIHKYQEDRVLMLGELWAIPIMIRLHLIRTLSSKASRILHQKQVQQTVHELLSRFDDGDFDQPGTFAKVVSEWMNELDDLNENLYLVEIHHQLQSAGRLGEEFKRWILYRFRQNDMTLDEAMRIEAMKQSRLQLSIQSAVNSLRQTSELDWSEFVEACSVVEKILKLDPAGHYPWMDFHTRDRYRRIVERLSKRSRNSETEVAEQLLLIAEESQQPSGEARDGVEWSDSGVRKHVGYYLCGDGYRQLMDRVGYNMPAREWITRVLEKSSGWYLTSILMSTLGLMLILWFATGALVQPTLTSTMAVLAVALFPALELSVSMVSRLFSFLLPPRLLPKMEYKNGIPDETRTIVVVPTLFASKEDVRTQVENLEVRYLANPDPGLQFGLLSDFSDSDQQETDHDSGILELALSLIENLNQSYSSKFGDKFFLIHRERVWNEQEGVWMGWERKRGKLEELNRLLMDPNAQTSKNHISGRFLESLRTHRVRYVITLDMDTRLPPDCARNLVRTIAHPLNQAQYLEDERRVVNGYGIIQPKVSVAPDNSNVTWFSKIFSGNVGIDPYSTTVSDIYQDLAGEAIYTGKGIYDVEAFHKVLDRRFPENRILSHDLIESIYARAGFASDIELFDSFPTTYSNFIKRNHRWTRGDWQIASWLLTRVPSHNGTEKNSIRLLSKWKIFDNLRRSLNPFFLMIFFGAGWFLLPGDAWIWTAAGFGILAYPIYISLYSDVRNRPARVRWKLYLDKVRVNLKVNSLLALYMIIILPHQSLVQLDAAIRTLFRLLFSRKHLLEWTTASQLEATNPNSLKSCLRHQWFSMILGFGILIISWFWMPFHSIWIVFPFVVAWAVAPFWIWIVNRPIRESTPELSGKDLWKLRSYARRTWYYFERFVTEEHNWLPPDNYQVDPAVPITSRTSPTNIGLCLVSTQVAFNSGYLTLSELLERVSHTLRTMGNLERFEGHFFNWYETRLGESLYPRYVSTVDSGNLAAALVTTKESIRHTMTQKGVHRHFLSGLSDTIGVVQEVLTSALGQTEVTLGQSRVNLICKQMLEETIRLQGDQGPLRLALLNDLKVMATDLNSIDLFSEARDVSDTTIQDLLGWQKRPLLMLDEVIDQLTTLREMEGVDLESLSPVELMTSTGMVESESAIKLIEHWRKLADEIERMTSSFIDEMNFKYLYLPKRGLFSIGFNVDKMRLDEGTYDLLASESRIASYIAIAKGEVPVEHWFRLSRRLTNLNRHEVLLSWGGTMFEYLMPLLFLKRYPETLLYHTGNHVVQWHKTIGDRYHRPWGFSESGYYFLNIELQYQYRAFGAPGLGLRRGLAEEYVVAPYASMLSMMIDPVSSMDNLKQLEADGGLGIYGFYDAVDYTPIRMSKNKEYKWVKMYMAHHHGMSLLAIENVIRPREIQDRFHSDRRVRACELILQEKVPRGVPIREPHPIDVELEPGERQVIEHVVDHAGIDTLDIRPPRLQVMTNGDYSLTLSHAGTGVSRMNGLSLTGWSPDPIQDPLGLFIYIRDTESGDYWSCMHQPVKRKPDRYDTWFHNGKLVTSRVDCWIETTTTVVVSPDDPMELRKLTITNYSAKKRTLDLTSYAEIVLNQQETHEAHPAFSKLFVQTDYLAEHHSILVKRRPRDQGEEPRWMIHTVAGEEDENLLEPLQFETERSSFVGRGRSLEDPVSMETGMRLSGNLGNVSDPIVSLRKTITLEPGEHKSLIFGLGYAETREEAERLADLYDNLHAAERMMELATVYSTVELNHLGVPSKEAHGYQKLASYLLYSDDAFRAGTQVWDHHRGTQKDLWPYGISGDDPLIVFRIREMDQLSSVQRLLKAHEFWRMKGLMSELVIINDQPTAYIDELQEAVLMAIQNSAERDLLSKRAGVFLLRSDILPEKDLALIQRVAHLVFEGSLPDLAKLHPSTITKSWVEGPSGNQPIVTDHESAPGRPSAEEEERHQNLLFFNGYGGFSEDGREYVIHIEPDPDTGRLRFPPAPWINVISNSVYGFLVSEKGAGYSWSVNSRENKLTEWANDAVTDPHSDAFYIRDDRDGTYWSPTPGPAPALVPYKVTHGFGYTRFENEYRGITSSLLQFVDTKDPVRLSEWTLSNQGEESVSISMFRYLDRVLGVQRNRSSRMVIQHVSDGGRTIHSRNDYNNEFAGRIAFSSFSTKAKSERIRFTTSREEFIGRNRSLVHPIALESDLKSREVTGIPNDPCAATQVQIHLKPGEEITVVFLDGEATSDLEADRLIRKYEDSNALRTCLARVHTSWRSKLGKIEVSTPDRSLNLLMNGWLLYQTISCRLWGRSALYQSGGAFGFRDQLQDSMALLYTDPRMTRNQILLHAGKQFAEGDVLHWWHPPTGRGIRSRITDDRLWLPFVTDFYLHATGDHDIFNERIPWITSRSLEASEHEQYVQPEITHHKESLYEHCCRAIDISLVFGVHGLPLIGSGDWNDGMNRVGENGRGESVWLGFFLVGILRRFGDWAEKRGDPRRAVRYRESAEELDKQLNRHGWDGEWYLRAYYDDGTPIGSSENSECRIDSISQSWAILSGAADTSRALSALLSAEKYLVSEEDRIIRLLTPPFDSTDKDPGYIKGYIPGVRENGGQYTHAALWLIKAMAETGWGDKAVRYLSMINPVNLTADRQGVERYKIEPYVIAADVYGEPPLTGMGGWSWYTGSGSWFYRVALESILGLRFEPQHLTITPSVSSDWESYQIRVQTVDSPTIYHIHVSNPDRLEVGLLIGSIDGTDSINECKTARIPVKHDGLEHVVKLTIIPIHA